MATPKIEIISDATFGLTCSRHQVCHIPDASYSYASIHMQVTRNVLKMIAIYAKCLLFCYIHIKNMSTGILCDKTSLTDNKTN